MPERTLRKLFGKRLRELRKLKKLSQEGLAEKADLHPTSIGLVERAVQSCGLDIVEKLAKGLHVEVRDLFLFAQGRNAKLKDDIVTMLAGKNQKDLEKIARIIKAME